MTDRLRILALEPYYGGSHRAVLDGLVCHVDAEWTLLTLPPRKWKWRMRGAAITMAAQATQLQREYEEATVGRTPVATAEPAFDLIFASTFVNLAEFRGLVGAPLATCPALVYFHENQLVYPNRHEADWDYQFPLTNITTALSADRCLFNTQWNLDTFVAEIPDFIRAFPDHHPKGLAEKIAAKSSVLAPPFDASEFEGFEPVRGERCRIIWPHRWEHDKNPDEFFAAVSELAREGLDFEVAIAGQSFRETATVMKAGAEALGERLIHCDEPKTRSEYVQLLCSADVAVSTAVNEFFGLAMIEACYAGATPVVPDRLAYPEIYTPEFRYGDPSELVARLRGHILHRPEPNAARELAAPFSFSRLSQTWSQALGAVASS